MSGRSAVWRMLIIPSLVAVIVGWTLRSLGAVAAMPSWAGFLITQLAVGAHCRRRLRRARSHLASIHSRRTTFPTSVETAAHRGD